MTSREQLDYIKEWYSENARQGEIWDNIEWLIYRAEIAEKYASYGDDDG